MRFISSRVILCNSSIKQKAHQNKFFVLKGTIKEVGILGKIGIGSVYGFMHDHQALCSGKKYYLK